MKRNLLIMALLLAGALALITYRGGSASYGVLYACILIPLASFVYLLHVYVKFRIYQSVDKREITKGSKLQYKFDISNEDIVAYTSIKVEFETEKTNIDKFDTKKVYSLVPGDQLEYATTLQCKYCGKYEVGVKRAIIKDYLRLFTLNYKVDNMIKVNVYPRILELSKLVIAPVDEDHKKSEYMVREQVFPDNQIKLYEPGEPAKRIHFKASAKMGKLMSKRYTGEPRAAISMVMVSHMKQEDELTYIKIMDKILEGTIAIANYFYRNSIQIDVQYEKEGKKAITIYDKSSFGAFYESLKTNELGRAYDEVTMFAYSVTSSPMSNYRIVVTPTLTKELMEACCEYLSPEGMITIMYIGDEDIAGYEDVHARINVIKVAIESDIEKVLTGEEEAC